MEGELVGVEMSPPPPEVVSAVETAPPPPPPVVEGPAAAVDIGEEVTAVGAAVAAEVEEGRALAA